MGDGKFAVVFQDNQSFETVKKLILGKGNFFAQMLHIAVFVPQAENHFSVLARNPDMEDEIKLMNIWKDGKFMFENKIFPNNRLRDLHGKVLTATTFDRAPAVYKKDDGSWGGLEVISSANVYSNLIHSKYISDSRLD